MYYHSKIRKLITLLLRSVTIGSAQGQLAPNIDTGKSKLRGYYKIPLENEYF